MAGIPYGLSVEGEHGEIHSIDKLILDYYFMSFDDEKMFNVLTSILSSSSDWILNTDRSLPSYNGYFRKKPSSSYSWFSSAFWTDGLIVRIGGYSRHGLIWWRDSRVRVEFNPNKSWFYRTDISNVIQWLTDHSNDCRVLEVDYAVDLLCKTSSVYCHSLKDKVIYNDSRYYGKRHKNGRLKIYNKRKEFFDSSKVDLDRDLTRCEITCKWGEGVSFGHVVALDCQSNLYSSLSSNLRSVAQLVELLGTYGEDKDFLLQTYVPDKRNRDRLYPVVFGQFSFYVFDLAIFLRLLADYRSILGFDFSFVDLDSSSTLGTEVTIFNNRVSMFWSEPCDFGE